MCVKHWHGGGTQPPALLLFDVLQSHPLPGTEKIKDERFYQMEPLSTVCNALFFIRNTHSVTTMPLETQCSLKNPAVISPVIQMKTDLFKPPINRHYK